MRNLFLLFIVASVQAVTVPLYIETDTQSVVSPDAPTTLAGYGITDAIPAPTPIDGAFLVGNGSDWVVETDFTAQNSLGLLGSTFGGQLGSIASTESGGAVGSQASSTNGFAGGSQAWATSDGGVALGPNAQAWALGAVQIGTGTNIFPDSIQFLSSGSVSAAEFGLLSGAETVASGGITSNDNAVPSSAAVVQYTDDELEAFAANPEYIGTFSPDAWNNGIGLVGPDGGGQLGNNASSASGGAVGNGAMAVTGFAGGNGASSNFGGAAVGDGASSLSGFSGGSLAVANNFNSVQLGTGTNSTSSSIQFLSAGSIDATQWNYLATLTSKAHFICAANGSITISNDIDNPNVIATFTEQDALGFSLRVSDGAVQNITGRSIAGISGNIAMQIDNIGGGTKTLYFWSEISADGSTFFPIENSLRMFEVSTSNESFLSTVSFTNTWPDQNWIRFVFYASGGLEFYSPNITSGGNSIDGRSIVWELTEQ